MKKNIAIIILSCICFFEIVNETKLIRACKIEHEVNKQWEKNCNELLKSFQNTANELIESRNINSRLLTVAEQQHQQLRTLHDYLIGPDKFITNATKMHLDSK